MNEATTKPELVRCACCGDEVPREDVRVDLDVGVVCPDCFLQLRWARGWLGAQQIKAQRRTAVMIQNNWSGEVYQA